MTGPVVGEDGIARCPWGTTGVLRAYHDDEWGRPVVGEAALFERLSLEGAQAGLSWLTILNKREGYRAAFHRFDVDACARLADVELDALMAEPGIVRNRAKISSVRQNARACIELRGDGGLEAFVESFAPIRTPKPARNLAATDDLGRIDGPVEGVEEARLRLRRPDHDVRADGSHRHRGHPPRGLPPAGDLRTLACLAPAPATLLRCRTHPCSRASSPC